MSFESYIRGAAALCMRVDVFHQFQEAAQNHDSKEAWTEHPISGNISHPRITGSDGTAYQFRPCGIAAGTYYSDGVAPPYIPAEIPATKVNGVGGKYDWMPMPKETDEQYQRRHRDEQWVFANNRRRMLT